jgi:hypothetical protein
MYEFNARPIVDGHGDRRPEHIRLGNLVRIIDCWSSIRDSVPSIHSMRLSSVLNRPPGRLLAGVNTSSAGPLRDDLSEALFTFHGCARVSPSLTCSSQIRLHPKSDRASPAPIWSLRQPMRIALIACSG